MSTEVKLKHRDKSKIRNVKKKQKELVIKKSETRKVRKISEKYLSDEVQVENSLKLRHSTDEDDYAKQKQKEVDFFCDPFSSVQLSTAKLSKSDPSSPKGGNEIERDEEVSQKSEAHSAHSNESHTHLASTYIGPEHEPVIEKFELTRITFDELKLLFQPKGETGVKPINDEESGTRVIKDEGIFVPEAPIIANQENYNLLLERLHESGSTDLIDASGELKNHQKLFDDDVYRLVCDKKFTPIFVPPTPMNFDSMNKIINDKKFLKIYISHMSFDQHHLFSNENHTAKVVEKLFSEYDRRKKIDVLGTLKSKLSNLRDIKAQKFPPPEPDAPKSAKTMRKEEMSLNHQIKIVRLKLHVEEKYDRMVLKSLLENWKNLKAIRTQQSYSFTQIILKIQKFEIDLSSRQATWQQQYDAELNEMIAEDFDEYHLMKQNYKEFIKSVNDPESIQGLQDVVKKPRKPDIDKIVAQVNEIYDDIPFDEPEVNIILGDRQEKTSGEATKPKEKLRKIGKLSYRLELEVDGEIIGSTKNCKLDEDFSILIQSAFILKLTKQLPERIKLMVSTYERESSQNKQKFIDFHCF